MLEFTATRSGSAWDLAMTEFNIFDAVGLANQEIRHSRFLAFLLDPTAAHGLGGELALKILSDALSGHPRRDLAGAAANVAAWNMDEIEVHPGGVHRAMKHMDIFLHNERRRLVCVIENKVWAGEHSNQLARYWELTEALFPHCDVVGLYLTPFGSEPSDPRYHPMSYVRIGAIIEAFLYESQVGGTLRALLSDYRKLLTGLTQQTG